MCPFLRPETISGSNGSITFTACVVPGAFPVLASVAGIPSAKCRAWFSDSDAAFLAPSSFTLNFLPSGNSYFLEPDCPRPIPPLSSAPVISSGVFLTLRKSSKTPSAKRLLSSGAGGGGGGSSLTALFTSLILGSTD